MTDQELKDLVAQTFKGLQELKAYQAETSEQMRKTDEQMRKTDEQMKRTDAKLERMGITLGNIGNNQGSVAEEFFYNSLEHNPTLGGIHYDFIDRHWSHRVGNLKDEFDIVMVNGKDIAIIEVKYKAHEDDLIKLVSKKIDNFKQLFPMYKDYTHHLVLATFSLYDEIKAKALAQGVTVLQRKGDTIESFVPAA
jgi:Holliday junction resolvase-like predicted endonuclease